MRSKHIPIEQTIFPKELEQLWGHTIRVRAYIAYRSVIGILDKRSGKHIRMPQFELNDIQIDGYNALIPTGIVMSPALWKCKGKVNDVVEFEGVLIKNEGRYVGFRMVKHVTVRPYQIKLFSEEETLVG